MGNGIVNSQYFELIWFKAIADLRVETARAYLGILWWLLEPLIIVFVYFLVFGVLFQRGGDGFVCFLLCGLIPWRWFMTAVNSGASSIFQGGGIMSQVDLPKIVFPLTSLASNSVKFAIIFGVLILALPLAGTTPGITWLALPLILVVELVMIFACCGIMSALVPLFPDLRVLVGHGLTLLFFMSGIFYDISDFSQEIQFYFQFNPMATLLLCYRTVLLEAAWPPWGSLATVALLSILGSIAAIKILTRYDHVYPKVVL